MEKSESCDTCCKLKWCALGCGFGVAEGFFMLLFAWAAWLFGAGMPMVDLIGGAYWGYGPSFIGGIVGFIYGFIIGFIFGFIVAWIYNLCVCCRKSSS
ncbi:MAG: hypothetical protein A3F14_02170 [Gammaproteobacteria bacterium RIFCSPHIGHO2_12_FULL_43_28]|nr:MAG: hypothetical protein A3F14_02170 [Gammaproteobacteria bacterium RIFCSPHIGHO2_12_FULL_43_28]